MIKGHLEQTQGTKNDIFLYSFSTLILTWKKLHRIPFFNILYRNLNYIPYICLLLRVIWHTYVYLSRIFQTFSVISFSVLTVKFYNFFI